MGRASGRDQDRAGAIRRHGGAVRLAAVAGGLRHAAVAVVQRHRAFKGRQHDVPVRTRRQVGLRGVRHHRRRRVTVKIRHLHPNRVHRHLVVLGHVNRAGFAQRAQPVQIRRQVSAARSEAVLRLHPHVFGRHVLRASRRVDQRSVVAVHAHVRSRHVAQRNVSLRPEPRGTARRRHVRTSRHRQRACPRINRDRSSRARLHIHIRVQLDVIVGFQRDLAAAGHDVRVANQVAGERVDENGAVAVGG